MAVIKTTNPDGSRTICFRYPVSKLFDDVSLETLTMADKMQPGQSGADSDRIDDYGLTDDEKYQFDNFLMEGHSKVFAKLLKMTSGVDDSIRLNLDPYINTPAIAKQVSITLTGTEGSATIAHPLAGTHLITSAGTLPNTASIFASEHAPDYLSHGIILTSLDDALLFTAAIPGVNFTDPSIENINGNLEGTLVLIANNVLPVAKIVRINFTGNDGMGNVSQTLTGSMMFIYNSSLVASLSLFVAVNADNFLAQGIILTQDYQSLVFEAATPGVDFDPPVYNRTTGTIRGETEVVTANVAAYSKRVRLDFSGTSGRINIYQSQVSIHPLIFAGSIANSVTNFVADHAEEYLGQGILLTASGDSLVFTANVPGVTFDSPVVFHLTDNLSGIVTHVRENSGNMMNEPDFYCTIKDKQGYNENYLGIISNEIYLAIKHYILKEWYIKCLLGDPSKYYEMKYVENMKAIQKYGLMLRKPMRIWDAPATL